MIKLKEVYYVMGWMKKKEVVGWATLDKFFIFKKCVLTQWNSPRTRKFLVKPGIQGRTSWSTRNFTIYERSFGYGNFLALAGRFWFRLFPTTIVIRLSMKVVLYILR